MQCIVRSISLKVSVLSLKQSDDGCDAKKQESRGSQDGEGSVQIQIKIEVYKEQETKIRAEETEIGRESGRSSSTLANNET